MRFLFGTLFLQQNTTQLGENLMQNHFSIPTFHFRVSHKVSLPKHLPRLLLDTRHQPRFMRRCSVSQHVKRKFELLDWDSLPITLGKQRTGYKTIPLCAYVGAYLVKIDFQLRTFGQLHRFLRDHPALLWALGFPISTNGSALFSERSEFHLPIQQHFSRKLSEIPNGILQNLLDGQVTWLQHHFGESFGDIVSIDTKHILAWVKENNPKQYVEKRFDKNQQPSGDPDCKLGCKRRSNQTPNSEAEPASGKASIGEFYWGYASGAVVTKVPKLGEFVLAELTQTFDCGDSTYFLPLMGQVENRLGRRPTYGTADAAFDAFYVYDYFHNESKGGFAAVPLRNISKSRQFDENGLPICEANLPFYLKGTFTNRTSLVQHQRGRYACPLFEPEKTADACPVDHKKWKGGGCKLVMPTSAGARIRYQLDRESDFYKSIYDQRTAVERIFSQAVELGIERPKLRNQNAIANHNTLTYILINLRAMNKIANLTP